ncbi:TonB-dependent receptor [Phenylobacterium deserti]|uniref:TonB-dependent receptor n=1 Tax=Phenylobacterium deserti TaxID=1914756 RepID=A0A328ADN7_9CAUL|nr:TonB-dependent receptor [Phenylobacterium deserti]RAK52760.1 TonB-dependent receptor [Phenylobacterium deserti]
MPSTPHTPPARLRRRLLATSLLAGFALAATPAVAAAADARPQPGVARPVNIPAGDLDRALLSLADQTGQQLLYPAELVRGRRAPALQGRFTADAALARLLAGTGLAAAETAPGVTVLRPASGDGGAGGAAAPRPFPDVAAAADPAEAPVVTGAQAAAPAGAVPTLAEVLVTGSHIRGVTDSPSPVTVLSRDDIDQAGHATVAAALQALPQNFSGVGTEGTATTGADRLGTNNNYASSVNLRGLGPDATLVLVNGRRMAGAGAMGDFSDVSALPTAAISRIEVLLDGASALYGSDAVGGVVNIVLRRDFEGAETRLRAGVGTRGEPAEWMAAQTVGRRWNGGSGLLSYEYHRRDALPAADRAFSASADLRPFGGTDQRTYYGSPGTLVVQDPVTRAYLPAYAIRPGAAGPLTAEDFLPGQANLSSPRAAADLLPQQRRHSLYGALSQELGDRLTLSGDLRLSERRFVSRSASQGSLISVTSANPFFASPTGAASHLVAYGFSGDMPPPRGVGLARSLGASFGGDLRLPGDWQASGYLAFAEERGRDRIDGLINSDALREAIGAVPDNPATPFSAARDGFFNPFAGAPGGTPVAAAFIGSGYQATHTRSRVSSVNLQADGSLLRLPGGPLRLAAGAQLRRETFERGGESLYAGVTPRPFAAVSSRRDITAAFAELRAPLVDPEAELPGLRRLELSLAGRVERYEDFGTTANPKLGLIWEPVADLRVRASYGTSFRSPSLRELSDPASNSPSLIPVGAVRVLSLVQYGGNPGLEPETATSWTAGLEYQPVRHPGLRLTAGWFSIDFDQRIAQPVLANLAAALTDPTLAPFVQRIDPVGDAADRARIAELIASPQTNTSQGVFPPESYGAIIDARYVNTAAFEAEGLDLGGAWRWTRGRDRWALAANGSYLLRFRQTVTPTSAPQDLAGRANYPARFRARASLDWGRGPFGLGVAVNHMSRSRDDLGVRIGAWTTADLQARLSGPAEGRFAGLDLSLSLRNLFDADPPFHNSPYGVGYDAANTDPVGRFAALQLTRRW